MSWPRWPTLLGGGAGIALVALLGGFVAVHQLKAAFLLIGLAWLIRQPAAALAAALIVTQELNPAHGFDPGASTLLMFGNELYFSTIGKVTYLEVVIAIAVVASLAHWFRRRRGEDRRMLSGVVLVVVPLLGAVLLTLLMYLQGTSLQTSVNQFARPWLETALCGAVGFTAHAHPGGRRGVAYAGAGALGLVALVGTFVFLTGGGASLLEGSNLVFYDSALPAVAGAVLLAFGLQMAGNHGWRGHALVAASGIILVLSFRRNVWLAVVVVLLVALVVRRNRGRMLLGMGAAAVAGSLLLVITAPSLVGALVERGTSWMSALTGGPQDASLQGHTNDLSLGLYYAQHAPSFFGWGPTHPALPGLVDQEGAIYVHNEYLYDWVRFGVLGLVAILIPVGAGVAVALRRLRRGAEDAVGAAGAMLLLVAPACAMTAAFLSATSRWPSLLGLAAGLAVYQRKKSTAPQAEGAGTPSQIAAPPVAEPAGSTNWVPAGLG